MAPHTILVQGGTVVDGTGAPRRAVDVRIEGERITAVAASLPGEADLIIDARGRVVAPGFIDIHTHSDRTLAFFPAADSKLRQGVTCEVIGLCGSSAAPLAGEALLHTERTLKRAGCELCWRTMEEYTRHLETQGLPPL